MEFKTLENKYWNIFYEQQDINYQLDRNLNYHTDFKGPLKNLPTGAKVLEIACGIRCDGIELARAGLEVYETDISEVAIKKARELYTKLKLESKGHFIRCDAENLPFPDNFFAASFIAASFHHLPNSDNALKEMKRVTQKNGYVILGLEPNAWPYYTILFILKPLKKLLRRYNKKNFHSIADDTTYGFTKKQLNKLFKRVQLKIISIKRAKYLSEFYDSGLRLISKILKRPCLPNRRIQRFFSQIDKFISKIPLINFFNWHWSVIAKKPPCQAI